MLKHRLNFCQVHFHRHEINIRRFQQLVISIERNLSLAKKNQIFDFQGHAARRPGYFYWNVYFLIVNQLFRLILFEIFVRSSSFS